MSENKKEILPVYLIIDSSGSMGHKEDENAICAFDAALKFLPSLHKVLTTDAALADKLRIEVITFDNGARVVVPLSDREQLENYLKQIAANPIEAKGDATQYGVAFKILRTEIEKGVRQLQSNDCAVIRPMAFFITDGAPNGEDPNDRKRNYEMLTEEKFEYRPNLICIGVGDATKENLKEYGASKYKKNGSYTTGNEHVVFVAGSEVSPAMAIKSIIPALLHSVMGPPQLGQAGSVPDVIQEDIFEDIEDDWN